MTVYRLIPTADPDDPNWDRAINHGEVVVLAQSTGEARAVAALAEAVWFSEGVPRATTQVTASAFMDERLYTVVEDDTGTFPDTGPVRVLVGNFSMPEDFVPNRAD